MWDLLVEIHIIVRGRDGLVRGNAPLETDGSSKLNASLRERFPQYKRETDLLGLVGPRLAECVSGKTDAASVMFGSLSSLRIMESFYADSPMLSTLNDQLVHFVVNFATERRSDESTPLRILEVGAGTGSATARLVEGLGQTDRAIEYTITDISSAFVAQAKRRFKQYPWVSFGTFDFEKDPAEPFRNHFDIVIGANAVHAASDRTAACCRLHGTLREGGFMVLAEVTRPVNWYDICFGLLDGWWLAEGGKGYPIQAAEKWMATFRRAGFDTVGCSQGDSLEAESQQLLVGWTR
ncbi:S-adenosyl-L-methionine-dependent methyltransferase [Massariosphaeria phaeospora]|uniref:S-adenosyl-L-methionine-dependent methyltransferase n=1 Tax=Massariosphaeria phaeospora TaxID=100035 RepID=A0A7C8MCQ8_9PLEO|nr:S-adenosyl-L-methionine-dependent methyltransferase [Massariosphaeria phaeospora]